MMSSEEYEFWEKDLTNEDLIEQARQWEETIGHIEIGVADSVKIVEGK